MNLRPYIVLLIVLQACQLLVTVGLSEVSSPKDVACSLIEWVPFIPDCDD